MRRKEPLRNIVARRVSEWIISSGVRVGERLLSEKDLAKLFGVNHLTVRDALSILEADGIVERRPRSGTYLLTKPSFDAVGPDGGGRDFVTLLIRNTGHVFADQTEILCREFQSKGLVPLIVPLPLDHNYVPALEHVRRTIEMGSEKLVISAVPDFWLEPLSSQIGVAIGRVNWRRIVWFGTSGPPERIAGDLVVLDMRHGIREGVAHLAGSGRSKIAFLTHAMDPKHPFPEYQRLQLDAYENAMDELDLEYRRVMYQYHLDEGDLEMLRNVLSSPDRPDAILATSDFRLLHVLKAAKAVGLRVPEDLALVGNQDSPWAVEYSLSSISSEVDAVTDAVVEAVTSPLRSSGRGPKLIKPRLVVRSSSGGLNDEKNLNKPEE